MHSFVSHLRKNNLSNGDVLGSPCSSYGNNFGNGTSPDLQQLSPLPSPRYASSPSWENTSNLRRSPYSRYGKNMRSSTSPKLQQLSPSQHYTSPSSFNRKLKAGFSTQTSEQSSINYNRSSNLSRTSTSNKSHSNISNLSRNSNSNTSYDNQASDSSFSTSFNYSGNRGKHFQNSSASKGNPGHSSDISLYVDPSMLEDPWKELMQKLEEENFWKKQ